jgi:hypothetical protein
MAAPHLFQNSAMPPIGLRSVPGPAGGGSGNGPTFIAGAGGGSGKLPFTMQTQAQTEWCWSATAVSVSLFFSSGSPWTQCSLANSQLNTTTCCSAGSSSLCNQPWFLDQALSATGNLYSWAPNPCTGQLIASELSNGRPIGCRIQWSDGTGHFVALSGYSDDGTNEFVDVEDPFYGPSTYDLSDFQTGYRTNGTWTHSYFTQP